MKHDTQEIQLLHGLQINNARRGIHNTQLGMGTHFKIGAVYKYFHN